MSSVFSLINAEPALNRSIEILIRVDDDDPELKEYEGFLSMPEVRLIVGPRGKGYLELWRYYDELARLSDATWLMQWNDDATMTGPWISELGKVVPDKVWCQCEVHRLGGSVYPRDDGAPFPMLPNKHWEIAGLPRIPDGVDKASIEPLRALGWHCHFLKGTSFHHRRDSDADLDKHRRL